jgi:hypothetical protein
MGLRLIFASQRTSGALCPVEILRSLNQLARRPVLGKCATTFSNNQLRNLRNIQSPLPLYTRCDITILQVSPCIDRDNSRNTADSQPSPVLPRLFHYAATWSRCIE